VPTEDVDRRPSVNGFQDCHTRESPLPRGSKESLEETEDYMKSLTNYQRGMPASPVSPKGLNHLYVPLGDGHGTILSVLYSNESETQ